MGKNEPRDMNDVFAEYENELLEKGRAEIAAEQAAADATPQHEKDRVNRERQHPNQRRGPAMNNQRRKAIDILIGQAEELQSQINTLRDEIEAIKDEEQEAFDNLPESMQQGDKGSAMEEAISALEDAQSEADSAADSLGTVIDQLGTAKGE